MSKATPTRRGSGLPTVLMVSALLLVVAFTVVGLGFNHLSVSNRLSNSVQARNLAEAAISKAIEELLLSQGDFGSAAYTGPKDTTVVVNFPALSAANGIVTFKSADASNYEVPLSTNNFSTDNSVTGSLNRIVPGDAVHLVGVGECNGVRKTVEAVLRLPRFHTLGSSGTIESKGGMSVTAVNSLADIGEPDKQIKSRLAANGAGTSINLMEPPPSGSPIKNNIHADVVGVGSIDVTTSNVTGELRPNAQPEKLPNIDLSTYDTAGKPGLTNLVSDSGGSTPVKGFTRFSGGGTRTITYDKLILDKGIFFVEGNLVVNQGVSGEGALIVTGETTINGGGVLASDNRVALLSGGDIKVTGDATHPAAIKGLVYGKGDVETNFTKVTGVVISNKTTGDNHVEMNNTTFTQVAELSDFKVDGVGGGGGTQKDSRDTNFPRTWDNENLVYGTDVANAMSNYDPNDPWKLGGAEVKTNVWVPPLNSNVQLDLSYKLKDVDPNVRFKSGDDYAINFYHANPVDPATGNPLPAGSYRAEHDANPSGYKLLPPLPGIPDLGWADVEVRHAGTVYPGTGSWFSAIKTDYLAKANALAVSQRGTPLNATEQAQCAAMFDAFFDPNAPVTRNLILGNGGSVGSQAMAALNITRQPGEVLINAEGSPGTGGATWEIHVSDFLNFAERVEILYWREL